MNDLLAARSQMAMSLAFHIVFAAIGIALPLLILVAEWFYLRTKDEVSGRYQFCNAEPRQGRTTISA